MIHHDSTCLQNQALWIEMYHASEQSGAVTRWVLFQKFLELWHEHKNTRFSSHCERLCITQMVKCWRAVQSIWTLYIYTYILWNRVSRRFGCIFTLWRHGGYGEMYPVEQEETKRSPIPRICSSGGATNCSTDSVLVTGRKMEGNVNMNCNLKLTLT